MAILVIKHSALGDMILALPQFSAIRRHHPDEHLVLLTTAPYVGLLQASGCFDEIWTDPRPKLWNLPAVWQLLGRIRSAGFSRIYDLQGSQRTRWYYRLLGSPRSLWVGNARGCDHYIPNPTGIMHVSELKRRQLALVGIPDPGLPDLGFLQADLSRYRLPAHFALLVPGGSPHRPAKRWPAAAFATLARHLLSMGVTPVLIGQAAEQEAIDAIRSGCPQAISLCGQTSIAEIASLARAGCVAVGNDTGPMHIIAASGCPSLVLYSAESDPRKVSPRGEWVHVLQKPDLQQLGAEDVIPLLPPLRA